MNFVRYVIASLVTPAILMETFSDLHGEVPAVPALGYWTCFGIVLTFIFLVIIALLLAEQARERREG